MSKKKENKKKDGSELDCQETQAMVKYNFTGEELVELGRSAHRHQTESDSLEVQLSSIKKDYQSRIEAAQMRRDAAFSKLTDGFEMREYKVIMVFNKPKKAMKTIYHLDADAQDKIGEFIREEAMTEADAQMILSMEAERERSEQEESGFKNPVISGDSE